MRWHHTESPSQPLEGTNPANTKPVFWPPGLGDNTFLLFELKKEGKVGMQGGRGKRWSFRQWLQEGHHATPRAILVPTPTGWSHCRPRPFLFPIRQRRDVTRRTTSILHPLPWLIKTRADSEGDREHPLWVFLLRQHLAAVVWGTGRRDEEKLRSGRCELGRCERGTQEMVPNWIPFPAKNKFHLRI